MIRMISKFNYFSTRTPKRQVATAVTLNRTLNYLQYGRYHGLAPRGQWLRPQGETTYAEVQAWGAEQIKPYPLAYHLILSPNEGQPTPDWFNAVVQQTALLADWRLIAHHDTAHPHTHCLFFAEEVWSRQHIQTWHQQIALVVDRLAQRENDLTTDLGLSLTATGKEMGSIAAQSNLAPDEERIRVFAPEALIEEENDLDWGWDMGW